MKGSMKPKIWGIRSKVWLEIEGKPIMGEGRKEILKAIGQYGSMLDASRATGIAYRRIRGAIKEMEQAIGRSLVNSHRGGHNGGGAALTPAAVELIKRFDQVSAGLQQTMDVKFNNIFK